MKQILQRKTFEMKKRRTEQLIMIVIVSLFLVMGSGLLISCGTTKETVLDSPKYHIPEKFKKDLVRESQPISRKGIQSESK